MLLVSARRASVRFVRVLRIDDIAEQQIVAGRVAVDDLRAEVHFVEARNRRLLDALDVASPMRDCSVALSLSVVWSACAEQPMPNIAASVAAATTARAESDFHANSREFNAASPACGRPRLARTRSRSRRVLTERRRHQPALDERLRADERHAGVAHRPRRACRARRRVSASRRWRPSASGCPRDARVRIGAAAPGRRDRGTLPWRRCVSASAATSRKPRFMPWPASG